MITRLRLATMAVGTLMAAAIGGFASPAHADPISPNCDKHPWGFLGLTKVRVIRDDPIRADASWMRTRIIGVPAHYQNASSSCSGGEYYSNCTFYPGGWVDAQISDNETYPVTPNNVLPDEPGHLG
jgi:hypothetical protein